MKKYDYVFARDVATQLMTKMEAARNGDSFLCDDGIGFNILNKMTSGLLNGGLIVVGGRPSMGKTSFVLNIARNLSVHTEKTVIFFSVELTKEQLVSRILQSEARISSINLRSGKLDDEEYIRLNSCINKLKDSKLIIDDTPGISVDAIYERALRIRETENIDLIIIDYLQLLSGPDDYKSRQEEMEYIVRKLKEMAKELGIPVMVTSQLSRAVEKREDHHPVLSDFRESIIEQDADTVIFIYREDYYKKDTKYHGLAEISVSKHRNGGHGFVYMMWDPDHLNFTEYDGKYFPDISFIASYT